jgi:outer membrane protein assembly factor BamB
MWYADATGAEQAYSSVILGGTRVFAFTGRGGGSIAIDAGGNGDVSQTNTVWTGNETASFGSPVSHKSKLYVVSSGVVTVVDGKTGDKIDQIRLQGAQRTGGRFGSLDYPSPIVVGDRMFYLNGSGQMFVFSLADELKQVAVNRVTADKESFGGSPAISDGRLILRSDKHLYCVADKGEAAKPSENAIAKTDGDAGGGRGGFGGGERGPGGAGERGENNRGGGGEGGNRRFDPMSIFTARDANKDGKLTADELAGSPMADRMKQLDKDGDKAVTQDEFRTGISTVFGGGRGGGGGGGNYRGTGKDTRPDRPQRPELAG